jgi:myb proto-oncogene protein
MTHDEKKIHINLKRSSWSAQDHKTLCKLVKQCGENWNLISILMNKKKSPNQCHEKWLNSNSNSFRFEFSRSEKIKIHDLHKYFGDKWEKISEFLPGRSVDQIKNYWHTYRNKISAKNPENTTTNVSGLNTLVMVIESPIYNIVSEANRTK